MASYYGQFNIRVNTICPGGLQGHVAGKDGTQSQNFVKQYNEKVPMKILLKDLLTAYKYGVKTLYYHNTRDGANDEQDDGCDSGACKL